VVHPVVLKDPETGRSALYVNQSYTTKILELRKDESRALLDFLFEQTHKPDMQVRVAWKPGSLVLWDNRRTQHCAIRDMGGLRIMYRVMVTPAR
jgi:taurine dioxygenase